MTYVKCDQSIMTPKFQCEMLACESTTPRCNPFRRQAECRKAGVSVRDFYFLFICCVWFLLFLKGKCSIFGLSWTFCKSSSLSLTKTPLISKGTTPICKQEIFKYDTRFSIPSMVSKVHFPNEWGIPYKSLEWASKILKLCSELLITATVLIPIVKKQQL